MCDDNNGRPNNYNSTVYDNDASRYHHDTASDNYFYFGSSNQHDVAYDKYDYDSFHLYNFHHDYDDFHHHFSDYNYNDDDSSGNCPSCRKPIRGGCAEVL